MSCPDAPKYISVQQFSLTLLCRSVKNKMEWDIHGDEWKRAVVALCTEGCSVDWWRDDCRGVWELPLPSSITKATVYADNQINEEVAAVKEFQRGYILLHFLWQTVAKDVEIYIRVQGDFCGKRAEIYAYYGHKYRCRQDRTLRQSATINDDSNIQEGESGQHDHWDRTSRMSPFICTCSGMPMPFFLLSRSPPAWSIEPAPSGLVPQSVWGKTLRTRNTLIPVAIDLLNIMITIILYIYIYMNCMLGSLSCVLLLQTNVPQRFPQNKF